MAEGREGDGASLEDKAQALRSRMEVSRFLHEMPKPTIAMVRGPAAGAGLSLALACDMRIASDNSKYGTAFARVGYSGDFGGSYFLTQLVGTAKARELYLTADLVDAAQALALGMVNRIVPDALLETETMALAQRLAKGPAVAYRYMKRNLNAAESGTPHRRVRPRGLGPYPERHDGGLARGHPRLRGEARARLQGPLTPRGAGRPPSSPAPGAAPPP